MWRIDFNEVAQADLLSFDKQVRNRILRFLEERVAKHPSPKEIAEPLEGKLKGLHRFRVGDIESSFTSAKTNLRFLFYSSTTGARSINDARFREISR